MLAMIERYEETGLQREHPGRRAQSHIRNPRFLTGWFPARPESAHAPKEQRCVDKSAAAVTLYLREVGQVPVILPQEEAALVARIKRGDRKARERLIKANLRRVVEISREYENIGLPLLDLISEGNVGLLKAVERFDLTNGQSFSAYSTWWIKQSIKRALAANSRAIRR